jgi:hypothetical protein
MPLVEIQLGTNSQKLANKGPSPSILIFNVMVQICINLTNEKKTRRVKIRCNACESLGGNVEGDWESNNIAVVNSMLKIFFLGKVFGRVV